MTEPTTPQDVLRGPEIDREQVAEQLDAPRADEADDDLPQDAGDEAADDLVVNEQGEAPTG